MIVSFFTLAYITERQYQLRSEFESESFLNQEIARHKFQYLERKETRRLRADFLSWQKSLAAIFFYIKNQSCKCLQPMFNENFCCKNCLRLFSAMTRKPALFGVFRNKRSNIYNHTSSVVKRIYISFVKLTIHFSEITLCIAICLT